MAMDAKDSDQGLEYNARCSRGRLSLLTPTNHLHSGDAWTSSASALSAPVHTAGRYREPGDPFCSTSVVVELKGMDVLGWL